jgi:hypothetical protein
MQTNGHGMPTLSQMVRDGRADTIQHGRRTRESLDYWFRQSERLNIARAHYGLRGTRFTDFARRIGVDRASAFGRSSYTSIEPRSCQTVGTNWPRPPHGASTISIPAGAPYWNGMRAKHQMADRQGGMGRATHGHQRDRRLHPSPTHRRYSCTKATTWCLCVLCLNRSKPMSV